MPQEIPKPEASPRAGGYKVGDEITMYNRTFRVSGFRPDGSPMIEIVPGKGGLLPEATPAPKPSGPKTRLVGPTGDVYEMTADEAKQWTARHPDWRPFTPGEKPTEKPAEQPKGKYDWAKPENFLGGTFDRPHGLEWLIGPGVPALRGARMGFGALKDWSGQQMKTIDEAGQRGILTPGQTGAFTYPAGFVHSK